MKWVRIVRDTITDVRKMFLGITAATVAVNSMPGAQPEGHAKTQDHPNIIFILADDLGWTSMNCKPLAKDASGKYIMDSNNPNMYCYETDPNLISKKLTIAETYDNTDFYTPNLSRLRAESMRFTQAYACPNCKPTRRALLTGKNPIRHNGNDWNTNVTLAETTLAEALDNGGQNYVSAFVGKWHVAADTDDTIRYPIDQGFEYTYGACDGLAHGYWESNYGIDGWRSLTPLGNPYFVGLDNTDPDNSNEFLTDALTVKALQFLESTVDPANSNYGKPFFLYLCYNAPHTPIQCPDQNYRDILDRMGIVGFWKFDEVGDGTASDSSNAGNDGKVHGATPITSTRKDSISDNWNWNIKAAEFDGSNDYIEIEDYKGITGNVSRTCSAWIKTTSDGDLIGWGNNDPVASKWRFGIIGNVLNVGVQGGYVRGTKVVTDNKWHHVAVTLYDDGSPNVNEVKLYVDGGLDKISSFSECAINTSSDINVRIGGYVHNPVYFEGAIDDVRIYNRALHSGEVEDLYNRIDTNAYYAGLVMQMDKNIGHILDAFDPSSLGYIEGLESNNTIIIFMSDNGGSIYPPGEHSNNLNGQGNDEYRGFADNRPLNQGKGCVLEGGIRVPLMVKWLGVVAPDTTSNIPVSVMDIFPTILQMAYGETYAPQNKYLLDGASFLPTLKNPTISPNRNNDYLILGWGKSAILGLRGIYKNQKYIQDTHINNLEKWHPDGGMYKNPVNINHVFYDLSKDISEHEDLYQGSSYLTDKLDEWIKSFKIINENTKESYDTVQKAVDAASRNQTIIIPPKTHKENIVIDKNITLTSINPSDPRIVAATIIDGSGSDSCITALSDCTLIGLTFTGTRGVNDGNNEIIISNCKNGYDQRTHDAIFFNDSK